MTTIYSKPEEAEPKKYRAEATGTDAEIAGVGGKKTLVIQNVLFQADADADTIATALLARLKTRKEYFEATTHFCPVPLERGDTVKVSERLTHLKTINHEGVVRGVRISVTPTSQTMTLIVEV